MYLYISLSNAHKIMYIGYTFVYIHVHIQLIIILAWDSLSLTDHQLVERESRSGYRDQNSMFLGYTGVFAFQDTCSTVMVLLWIPLYHSHSVN